MGLTLKNMGLTLKNMGLPLNNMVSAPEEFH